jgi:uncharacterized membrane protein
VAAQVDAVSPNDGTGEIAGSKDAMQAEAEERRSVERERDFDRFLSFIDAIVAIAVTLLVLPLVEIAGDVTELSVDDLLFQHAGQLFSFFLSFFVIAQLWFAQHNIVRTVIVQDKIVTRCLMAWALTIVVLPVPTALVSGSHEGDKTEVLYIATMALSSLALAIAAWRVARTPGIRDGGIPPNPVDALTTLAIMVLAMVLSLVIPGAGYLPLLLLLLSRRVSILVRSRRKH